jgi:DNA excision repair protein ERCC-5
MGVKGLWRLLLPIGRRVSIETLEGKILAVDASIWLTQFLKAMRDPDSGKVRPAAHLIGFIRRICKLRYQGIRPVFVFDGATPEIKQREVRERRRRRERFRGEEDSVHRMAKRLLVQQLKKQGTQVAVLKKTKKKDSGEGDTTTKDTTTAAGAYAPGFYDPEMENEKSSPGKDASSKNPVEPEIVDLLLEDEQTDYLDQATSRANARSDWDIKHDEDGSQKQGQDPSQTTDIRNYSSAERNDFDVEHVASLPSTKRKDVVEDAQRKRRLQSRREFMKVAYDPEGLSKCQLRNFLKSTKLNRNIQEMAQKASKADGLGDTPDRIKRIIFEAGDKDNAQKKKDKEKTLQKFRKVRKLSIMSSSEDESDEDVEWRDEKGIFDTFGATARPRAIIEDDDCTGRNNGERDSHQDTTRKEGGHTSSVESVARMPSQPLSNRDEDAGQSDRESDAGGFITSLDLQNVESMAKENLPTHSSFTKTVTIDDSEACEDERKMPAWTCTKRDDEGGPELNDEAIAIALQQDEYTSDDDGGGGFLSNNCVAEVPDTSRECEKPSEDSEDESICWEDGEGEGGTTVNTPSTEVETKCSPKLSHISTEKRIPTCQSKTSSNAILGPQPGNNAVSSATELAEECNNDESVEWEDCYDGEGSSAHKTPVQKELTVSAMRNELGASLGKNVDGKVDIDMAMRLQDSWVGDFPSDNGKNSEEIAIALEHAQATAANLTNWAGRAFRRAVAQHAEENGLRVPESAKPKSVQRGISGQASPLSTKPSKTKERDTDQAGPINQEPRTTKKSQLEIGEHPSSSKPRSTTQGGENVLETLAAYQEKWTEERNQEDRDMDTVTDEMRTEAMTLLQLFGVPYVEAPAEAEAQCVMLEKLGLVDGIVTEDSDAFVFGGKRVYKNIFEDQKFVEAYDAGDAEREMNLTRDGLVALAMLLGGDYTEGVKGVGIVNGMEIVHAFDASVDLKVGLSNFRTWLDGFNPFDSLQISKGSEEMTKERIFHRKHHSARTRWLAPKSFPSRQVMTAYLNPVVDASEERFSWGVPDMDRLIIFMNKHAGWNPEETRKLIQPVIDKISSSRSMHQTRMESFMRFEDSIRFADVRSKRLRDVLSKAKTESADQDLQKAKRLKNTDDDAEPSESKFFD